MEELVLRAKNGDADAYTQLILEIKNDLYKICKTRLTDDNEIEDMIQDTMIQTFKNIKKLKDPNKFKFWVIKILINQCNHYYRKKNKRKIINIEDDFNNFENELFTNNIENIESDMAFYQLLNNLKYEERIIIILYYSEQFTFKEISQILKINENTVKTRLYRAKENIKNQWEGEIKNG